MKKIKPDSIHYNPTPVKSLDDPKTQDTVEIKDLLEELKKMNDRLENIYSSLNSVTAEYGSGNKKFIVTKSL